MSVASTSVVRTVLNSGAREREALLVWWNRVADATGYPSATITDPGPFWRALGDAKYDPITDAIAWRNETKSIQEINNP